MKNKRVDIIDAVVKLRIEKGLSTKSIVVGFLMGEMGFKQSYAYELLRDARKKIEQLYDVQNKQLVNEALGSLEQLYEEAVMEKNRKLALEIRREINKLTGVYAVQKVDMTSGGEKIQGAIINIISPKD